jgi:molecular chaperone GrpE
MDKHHHKKEHAEETPPSHEAAPSTEDKEHPLEQELKETKDKLLRALAETDNLRKRAERDRVELTQYAITNFARDLLSVADNLSRAIDSLEKAEHGDLRSLLDGVKITEKELCKVFEKYHIKKIEPLDSPFDHNFHQAMFEIENDEKPAGTVVQLMQAGYVLGDRLLRPALVAVAKSKTDKKE